MRPGRYLLTLVCFFASLPAVTAADDAAGVVETTGRGPRVLLVLIDRIGIDDIDDPASRLPNIQGLMESGSTGLMNARVRYGQYGTGGYLLIGSGGRVIGGDNCGFAFNSDSLLVTNNGPSLYAGDIYSSLTGRSAEPGSVVNLYIEEMLKLSDSYLSTSTPGLLGETLRDSGRKAALVGNADSLSPGVCDPTGNDEYSLETTPGAPSDTVALDYSLHKTVHREASCIAMDEHGLIPDSDVSSRFYKENLSRTGLVTDFDALIDAAGERLASSDLLVVDMGQTSRVDENADLYSDDMLDASRSLALAECDRALGNLLELVDPSRDLVIVCTPTPAREMSRKNELLTPLIISGPGFGRSKHLTSATTRRSGLVSNYDVAPTILEYLGVDVPSEMEGAAVSSTDSGGGLGPLVTLRDEAVYSSNIRGVLVKLFAIPGLAIIILLLLLSLLKKELVVRHPYFWSVLLLSLLATPLVYLLLPLLPVRALQWSILIAIASVLTIGSLSLALFLKAKRTRSGKEGARVAGDGRGECRAGELEWVLPRSILSICAITLTVTLVDPFLGSPMIALSPFGAGLTGGGRYYGIGNIYLGIAFGAAIVIACLTPDVLTRVLNDDWKVLAVAGVTLLATTFILGFPGLGANLGALITGVITVPFILIKLKGWKIGWKHVVIVAGVLVLCVAFLLVVDVLLPGSSSHAGRLVTRVKDVGFSDLAAVVIRKIEMNWNLLFSSIWRLFFFAGILAAVVWHLTVNMFHDVDSRYPHMSSAWLGMIVAITAGILFNDTGIESAGAIVLYFIVPAFLLFLPQFVALNGSRNDARGRLLPLEDS